MAHSGQEGALIGSRIWGWAPRQLWAMFLIEFPSFTNKLQIWGFLPSQSWTQLCWETQTHAHRDSRLLILPDLRLELLHCAWDLPSRTEP